MEVVDAGRRLIGDTLGFHLFFVLFGVGLPVLISLIEGISVWRKKPRLQALARQWSKALVVLFIAGAISGTLVSLQFSLFWPVFTTFAGKVVGISFALEGFAFLIEALFLSIYMLSWKRLKPLHHWLLSLPIVFGSLASAFFITTVNAWMNTPQGFKLDGHGNPIDINTKQAVFNPAVGTETSHSILAYLFATTLVVLAVYAWIAWRRHEEKIMPRLTKLMTGLAALALIFGSSVVIQGDSAGRFLAKHEPAKLAAAEGLETTQSHAPLIIGGIARNGHIEGGLRIPSGLSILATHDPNGVVKGLDQIPAKERPPLSTHYFFDGMVLSGTLAVAIPALYLILRRWRPSWSLSKPMLILLIVAGFLGIIATEFGWLVTEFGRQPYVIQGVMKTSEAVTTNRSVIGIGELFPIFYLILLTLTILAIRKTFSATEALK